MIALLDLVEHVLAPLRRLPGQVRLPRLFVLTRRRHVHLESPPSCIKVIARGVIRPARGRRRPETPRPSCSRAPAARNRTDSTASSRRAEPSQRNLARARRRPRPAGPGSPAPPRSRGCPGPGPAPGTRVAMISAAFVAQYGRYAFQGRSPPRLATLTIAPPPRRRMCGAAACDAITAALTLTSKASSSSVLGESRPAATRRKTPTLLTSRSRPPSAAAASFHEAADLARPPRIGRPTAGRARPARAQRVRDFLRARPGSRDTRSATSAPSAASASDDGAPEARARRR